jgi:hypothetical protein
MSSEISSYLPVNIDNEQHIISYLIRNQGEIHRTNKDFFFDATCRLLYNSLTRLHEDGLFCEVGILFEFAKEENSEIQKEIIQNIYDTFTKFENIDHVFVKLKDYYISTKILKQVEDIASKTLDKNSLDIEGIKTLTQLLSSDIVSLGNSKGLIDSKEMVSVYREEQIKREQGIARRSLGFSNIDKLVTRPASPEETTILVGLKGCGKSAVKLCIENNLVNQGVCVISFNPEMPLLSNMDRWVGMRSGIPIKDLLKQEKEQALKTQIERELKRLEQIPNFLYYEDANLDLYLVLDRIRKAKQIFSDKGVLPKDEYVFVTFDTFDGISEFESAKPEQIKGNMNKFHRIIVRKEQIHALALLQGNENKLRQGKAFKKPEDLDFYQIGFEDIEGGASFAAKARVVLSINRPVQMKKALFSSRMEEWNMENDLLNISCVKQNDGPLFFTQFSFNENMRIYPYVPRKKEGNDETSIN